METCSRKSCCKTFCTSPRLRIFGNKFFDQLGMAVAKPIEQALGFLASQQFVGVLANDFGEVGGEDGSLVDDGIAGGQGLRFEGACNPESGDAESGLAGGSSGERGRRESRS